MLSRAIDALGVSGYAGVAMVHPLHVYRQAHRLTRRTLAAQLGCSTKTLFRWEKGQYCPRLALALQVSQVTGLPVEALKNSEGTVVPATS